jgi:hypothetical protein
MRGGRRRGEERVGRRKSRDGRWAEERAVCAREERERV